MTSREVKKARSTSAMSYAQSIQITVINIVFSFDSILTAIGMTNGISPNPNDALILMVIAVVISVLIMMLFANPVGEFVNRHPSVQVLGLVLPDLSLALCWSPRLPTFPIWWYSIMRLALSPKAIFILLLPSL